MLATKPLVMISVSIISSDLSMNALGSDAFMWRQKHNVIHHTYTNIDGVDDDIAKSPLLRMSETQPRFKAHRFQHIYLTFLYAISTIFWVLLKDFQHYFMGHGYAVEVGKMKLIDHLMFWTTKLIYMGLYIVLPIMVWGVWPAIVGFILMHAMLGSVMSFVFQLAHVVENVEFEHHHGEVTEINSEWASSSNCYNERFCSAKQGCKLVSWRIELPGRTSLIPAYFSRSLSGHSANCGKNLC